MVYLTGNGNSNSICVNANFDTSTIEGETYQNNLVSLTWEEFTSRPNQYQVKKIIGLIDRIVHADEQRDNQAESLFAEVQLIEEQEWFNGYNYPAKFVKKLQEWLKSILQA